MFVFYGFNKSNSQIAQEPDLNQDDIQQMTKSFANGNRCKKAGGRIGR
jgi:hypothetical protein